MEFPFISTFAIMETIPHNSSQSSSFNPLFSSIVTFYVLIVFCFPQFSLKIILSPLLIFTFILLLCLLRLGTTQQQQQQPFLNHGEGAKAPPLITQSDLNPIENHSSKEAKPEPEPNRVVNDPRQEVVVEENVTKPPCNTTESHAIVESGPRPRPGPEPEDKSLDINICARNQCLDWAKPEPDYSPKLLVEWDVGAPLEVIYEAYEGEEEGEEDKNDAFWRKEGCHHDNQRGVLERYPSLSRYYPESELDSDSESSSSSMSWDGEYEDKEGLIEIALDCGFDGKKVHNVMMSKVAVKEEFCLDDEDNLIEIDIFPTKK